MYDEANGNGHGAGGTFEEAARELELSDGTKLDGGAAYKVQLKTPAARGGSGVFCLALLIYVGLAANAAYTMAYGAYGEVRIHSTEQLCTQHMRLTGEIKIHNPSTWDASISGKAFSCHNADGLLLTMAEADGIQPSTLTMPALSDEWQPIVLTGSTVSVPGFGALFAKALADGTTDVTMAMTYSGGLDNFPIKAGGTMKVLVTTDTPDSQQASTQAAVDDGTQVVRLGKLEFSGTVKSMDPPVVSDTAEGN